uniref:Transposable element P transposase-like RNase H domain-containing protein n=1 Tax=Daphnia galeata TaxID=27404 RepID=A0A8J2RLU7_9CRUS|nr:unnamed protein product [Daphnia galeata]
MPSLEIKKYKSYRHVGKRWLACSPIIIQNSNNVVVFRMQVKKDLAFDKGTLEHHGIVNFGKAVRSTMNRAKIEKGLGVHIPVFMFRPYKAKWVQPFACFASKGAAFGSILFELILKVIVILHNHRAVVKGVVSDGAQSNKSAYAMFGIDERKENLRMQQIWHYSPHEFKKQKSTFWSMFRIC